MTPEAPIEDIAPPRLALGNLARRTFSAIKNRPLLFLGLTAVVAVPLAFMELAPTLHYLATTGHLWVGSWKCPPIVVETVSSLLRTVVSATFAYIVFQRLKKDCKISLGQTLSRIQKQIFPLIGIAIVFALILLSFSSILWKIDYYIYTNSVPHNGLPFISIIISNFLLFALLLPSIAFVISVCVIEQLGFLACLRRISELTRGLRMSVFFLLFKILFAYSLVFYLALVLYKPFDSSLHNFLYHIYGPWTGEIIYRILLEFVEQLVREMIGVFFIILSAVAYCDIADYKGVTREAGKAGGGFLAKLLFGHDPQ